MNLQTQLLSGSPKLMPKHTKACARLSPEQLGQSTLVTADQIRIGLRGSEADCSNQLQNLITISRPRSLCVALLVARLSEARAPS